MNIRDNHKRPIESALWMLDELLCAFERWVRGNETHSLLYQEHNSLTDKQRLQLHDEIAVLQKILKVLKDELHLKGYTLDVAKSLQGSSMVFVEHIEDIKGRRLADYGKPSEELVKYLDPKLDEIINHLARISHIGTDVLSKSQQSDKPK